ncbi:hypothetical protein POM88_024096 [Heracleum sosnowskyi]|uniref:Brf1 TBP-binding domain-containing protein n=1 Tax=Heracleum sosnowskyi TaxID=360622 RepID=A0AAD8IIV2_9APIA|nr:hypothetical protein POM88_024096 [Heracleum sosnowskyi]
MAKFDKRSEILGERRDENMKFTEDGNAGGATKKVLVDDAAFNKVHSADNMNCKSPELESMFDIEDLEVDNYIHTAEETQYKTIIQEELNREYVEEQLAKEAVAAAAKEAYEEHLRNCPKDMEDARKLAADVAVAMEQTKKERRQRRALQQRLKMPLLLKLLQRQHAK